MGSVLIETNKYGFDKLEYIREAYEDAFGGNNTVILKNTCLDTLHVVRNVLVHNAGVADGDYLRRKSILPTSAIVEKGEPIPLDGELVVELVAPALELGNKLIESVDQWLMEE
jgi:hypothetical protein